MHLSAACVKICNNLICITRYNYNTRVKIKGKAELIGITAEARRDYTIVIKNSQAQEPGIQSAGEAIIIIIIETAVYIAARSANRYGAPV